MKFKKEKKSIAIMLSVSIFLLALSLITAVSSISYSSISSGPVNYDVYFTEVGTNKDVINRVIVSNNRIDIGATFKEPGETLLINTSINNDGNINTKLDKLLKTNLEDTVVGTSDKTGTTYTLNDFISYRVYYEKDNDINNVKELNNLEVGDKLRSNTINNLVIRVMLKEKKSLTEDQKYVLSKLDKEEIDGVSYNVLNVNLYLEAIYLED